MVVRRPPGFNVDLAFGDSREVLAIPARHRNAAIGLWTRCGAWSANKLTDGHVPAEVLKAYGATPALVAALVASTLWKPGFEGDVWFTNWPRWQRTRDEVTAYRQVDAQAKRDARRSRVDATQPSDKPHEGLRVDDDQVPRKRKPRATTCGDTQTSDGMPAELGNTIRKDSREPENRVQRTEIKDGGGGVGNSPQEGANSPSPPPPKSSCPQHPNGTADACADCAANRRRAEAAVNLAALHTANARQRELALRATCTQCDPAGWLLDVWQTPVEPAVRCNHQETTQ